MGVTGAGALRRVMFGAVVLVTAVAVAPAATSAAPVDAGSVSGTVVDGGGQPLGGICVNVEGQGGVTTDGTGTFLVEGIEPGDHLVQFGDCNSPPTYVSIWYPNAFDRNRATLVTVPPNANQPLGDVTMHLGVRISGTVTSGGAALNGIFVNVNPYDGSGGGVGASTDVDGNYVTQPVPDGRYRVQFNDGNVGAYATQYWDGQDLFNRATPLDVSVGADGDERRDVDAVMSPAGTIAGVVTGRGAPAPGICVNANTPDPGNGYPGLAGATTGADGRYRISGLPTDRDIRVSFHDCNQPGTFVDEWYNDVSNPDQATPITLSANEVHEVDADLAVGVRVAGTVTDSSGRPIRGISVNVNPDGQGPGGFGQTGPDGHYVTSPVPAGKYRVQFRDDSSAAAYASLYWNQQPSFNTANLLDVAGPSPQIDGIDAQLERRGDRQRHGHRSARPAGRRDLRRPRRVERGPTSTASTTPRRRPTAPTRSGGCRRRRCWSASRTATTPVRSRRSGTRTRRRPRRRPRSR